MPAPALRIPVALDLDALRQQSEKASNSIGQTVVKMVNHFRTVNSAAQRVNLGIGPVKAIELAAKGSATALGGVSTGLSSVGSAAGKASQAVPQLRLIETGANAASLAAAGLGRSLSAVGVAAGAANALTWRQTIIGTAAATFAVTAFLSVISRTRGQLQEMVEIADKATNANVGTGFFQGFLSEADKMRVSASDLEDALSRAFRATQEKSPIELSKWETGKEKITEVEKALRVFNATGEKITGLVLFRDAQNQEDKVIAVLTAMKELEEQGRKLESLQLGELFFGQKFVDNIRVGKTTASEILETMKKSREAGSGIISEELIKRAKEIDDQLKIAANRLDQELKPVWNDLAKTMLGIKSLWADVVGLIADALRIANQFTLTMRRSELSAVNRALDTGESLIPGVPRVPESVRSALGKSKTIEQDLLERKAALEAEIADLEGSGRPRITVSKSRGEGARPTLTGEGESRTRFDSAIDSAEKRAAALNAEADAINLGTAARERAKLVAELETVAKQANTAAGKENTEVTAEQREEIERVATAYETAAAKLEMLRGPLGSFIREGSDLNKAFQEATVNGLRSFENALVDVAKGTITTAEAFKRMTASILEDIGRILIRSAIAKAAGALLPGFGGGAVAGSGFINGIPQGVGLGGYGGSFASGGMLGAGKWGIAGENGPEIIKGPAQIIPNDITRSIGSGATITYAPTIDARGADIGAVARLEQVIARDRMEFESRVKSIVRSRSSQRW